MPQAVSRPEQPVIAEAARRSLRRAGRRVSEVYRLPVIGQPCAHKSRVRNLQVGDRLDIGASRTLIENNVLSKQSASNRQWYPRQDGASQ